MHILPTGTITLLFTDIEGHRSAIANQLECFALIAIVEKQFERAGKLFGAAEALREKINSVMADNERIIYDKEVAQFRSMRSETDFNSDWSKGRALTAILNVEMEAEKTLYTEKQV